MANKASGDHLLNNGGDVTSPDDLIPTRDVCEILDITPSGVSRIVARGALTPAAKAPGNRGAFFFSRTDVERLAAARAAAARDSEAASA